MFNRYSARLMSTARTAKPKSSKLMKFALYSTGTLGTLYAIDVFTFEGTAKRTLKSVAVLTTIGLDYKINFNDKKDAQVIHQRNADRLFNLLNENKGLYIKFGQNLANQASVLPKSFQEQFSKLYDSAASDPWDKVEEILIESIGPNYQDHFEFFDKNPIASASIAQVHRATLKNGDKVAVKVQHYYIKNQIDADLLTYRTFIKLFSWGFDIPFGFMGQYISERLKEEVDFNIELKNGEKADKLIKGDSYLSSRVHVPHLYDNLSSKRVLVAEWCEGEPLFRYDELKKTYNTKEIMNVYLTLFSKMIFQWGFVHSDPHPGNLLVRPINGKQELVLLDHGLYVTFDDKLRHQYCSLWKAIFELDQNSLKEIAISWGIGDKQSDMFGSFAQLKPYHESREKLSSMTKEERQKYMKENFKNFFQNTAKFPLEMIFLGRTMRMLQTLNQKYHAPVNRINLFTREAVAGFYLNPAEKASTLTIRTERILRYSIFMMVMTLSDLAFYVSKLSNWILGTKTVEDVLQKKMMEDMKDYGIENPDNVDFLGG